MDELGNTPCPEDGQLDFNAKGREGLGRGRGGGSFGSHVDRVEGQQEPRSGGESGGG